MDKELERLDKLKLNSIENQGKKKKGCTSCKKKKEINEPLPPLEVLFIPTNEDIKLAYAELTSFGGVKADKKIFINEVYKFLFNEEFDFNCRNCVNAQARKFTNYLKYELKLI